MSILRLSMKRLKFARFLAILMNLVPRFKIRQLADGLQIFGNINEFYEINSISI